MKSRERERDRIDIKQMSSDKDIFFLTKLHQQNKYNEQPIRYFRADKR